MMSRSFFTVAATMVLTIGAARTQGVDSKQRRFLYSTPKGNAGARIEQQIASLPNNEHDSSSTQDQPAAANEHADLLAATT